MSFSPLFSNVCCPAGAIAQNGICYCTSDQSNLYPFACRVVCQSLNPNFPPSSGGCQCETGYAGPLCDLKPCYINHGDNFNISLYCQSDQDRFIDCSTTTNLPSIDNYTQIYQACPCLNGGTKIMHDFENPNYSCLCPNDFSGDLCEKLSATAKSKMDDETNDDNNMTANTFLGIIALSLFLIALAFCLVRRHRRRKRKLLEQKYDCHRHYQPAPDTPGLLPAICAPLLPHETLKAYFGKDDICVIDKRELKEV